MHLICESEKLEDYLIELKCSSTTQNRVPRGVPVRPRPPVSIKSFIGGIYR
ncbi:hypothetical protein J2W41_002768 [Bacillus pumilus]|nr:hypothetical protein [Bacillus pumilus]